MVQIRYRRRRGGRAVVAEGHFTPPLGDAHTFRIPPAPAPALPRPVAWKAREARVRPPSYAPALRAALLGRVEPLNLLGHTAISDLEPHRDPRVRMEAVKKQEPRRNWGLRRGPEDWRLG